MEWSLRSIKAWVCVVIVGALSIGIGFELLANSQDGKLELSNNITIIVEIAVGIIIAVIIYGLTKIEQQKTDKAIRDIRDVTNRLEKFDYDIEKRQIERNCKLLDLLLRHNKSMSNIYEEIKKISEKNRDSMRKHMSELKAHYHMYNDIVKDTPILYDNPAIILARTKRENLDIYWKENDWDKVIEDLKHMILTIGPKIATYNTSELQKLDSLKANYERKMVKSDK